MSQMQLAAKPSPLVALSKGLVKEPRTDIVAHFTAKEHALPLRIFRRIDDYFIQSIPDYNCSTREIECMIELPKPLEKKLPPLLALPLPLEQLCFTYLDEPHNLSLSFSFAACTPRCVSRYLVPSLQTHRPRSASSGPLNASIHISSPTGFTRATAAWRCIHADASRAGPDTNWDWSVAVRSARAF